LLLASLWSTVTTRECSVSDGGGGKKSALALGWALCWTGTERTLAPRVFGDSKLVLDRAGSWKRVIENDRFEVPLSRGEL
jgi:hypothetical protein